MTSPRSYPKRLTRLVAERLLVHGRMGRGYLGLGLRPIRLDEETVRRLSVAKPYGLMVVRVDVNGPGGSADSARCERPSET